MLRTFVITTAFMNAAILPLGVSDLVLDHIHRREVRAGQRRHHLELGSNASYQDDDRSLAGLRGSPLPIVGPGPTVLSTIEAGE